MLRDGKTKINIRISRQKEDIIIDNDVLSVIEIMNEIIEYEKIEWRKKFFSEIKKGLSDVAIIVNYPMGRTKYYIAKKEFVDKIYQYCIYKGLLEYEDILKAETR